MRTFKTGKVADAFGVSRRTITNWCDQPEIAEFLSDGAKGVGLIQREVTETDLIILNTVRALRAESIHDWSEIALRLRAGYRELVFPATAANVDLGLAPIEAYSRMAITVAELTNARTALAEKDKEIARLNTALIELEREKDAEKEKLLRELAKVESEKANLIGRLENELQLFRDGRLTAPRSTE
jgi:hypothetical protein